MILGCSGGEGRSAEHARVGAGPDLLVITWSAVRADQVGPGAQEPRLTPRLDALAVEGLRFVQARTPSPAPLPAAASMLTGLLPPKHGARVAGLFQLDPSVDALPKQLRSAGYQSAAFVSDSDLDPDASGLGALFDHYTLVEQDPLSPALVWLAEQPSNQRIFLWLQLSWSPSLRDLDERTGQLLDAFATAGRLDQSVVVIHGDRGLAQGAHGEPRGGLFAYDSTMRVPLVFWAGPGAGLPIAAGTSSDVAVTLADIAPTLAVVSGVSLKADGADLGPVLTGSPLPARSLALESLVGAYDYASAPVFLLVDKRGDTWLDLPSREHYAASDLKQRVNLYTEAEEVEADSLFAAHDRRWPPSIDRSTLGEQEIERLEALGYIGGGSDAAPSAAFEVGRDPKQLLPVAQLVDGDSSSLPLPLRLARGAQLWEDFGPLPKLMLWRAAQLEVAARPLDALALLSEASEANPGEKTLKQAATRLRAAKLRDTGALRKLKKALVSQPEDPVLLLRQAELLGRLQRCEEARPIYAAVARLAPESGAAAEGISRCDLAEGTTAP